MQVQVVNDSGAIIWAHGKDQGMTSKSYPLDGTQDVIIAVLKTALEQAKAEMINATFEKALEETRNSYPVIMQYLAGKNQDGQ